MIAFSIIMKAAEISGRPIARRSYPSIQILLRRQVLVISVPRLLHKEDQTYIESPKYISVYSHSQQESDRFSASQLIDSSVNYDNYTTRSETMFALFFRYTQK